VQRDPGGRGAAAIALLDVTSRGNSWPPHRRRLRGLHLSRDVPSAPWAAGSRWRAGPDTLAVLLVGLWAFGTGEALLVAAHLGTSPWTVLAVGITRHTPLSTGEATLVVSLAVLAAWLPLRERPGLGTLANAVVIAVAIDVMGRVLPHPPALLPRLVMVFVGIALIGVGSGLYLTAAMGPGPRDGLMTGLHRRFGWPVARIRLGIEAAALLVGWLLGGTVGVGTVLFAGLVGAAVALALGGVRAATASVTA